MPAVALKLKDTNAVAETNYVVAGNGEILFSHAKLEHLEISVTLSNVWLSAIRLEVVPKEEPPDSAKPKKKRKAPFFALSAKLKPAAGSKEVPLGFYYAEADHETVRYANGFSVLGVKDRWQLATNHVKQTAVWLLEAPVRAAPGDILVVDLGDLTVTSARLSVTPFAAKEPLMAGGEGLNMALGKKLVTSRSERELAELTFLLSGRGDSETLSQWRRIKDEIRQCRNGRTFSLVTTAREPMVTRVLPRGNWLDDGKAKVAISYSRSCLTSCHKYLIPKTGASIGSTSRNGWSPPKIRSLLEP